MSSSVQHCWNNVNFPRTRENQYYFRNPQKNIIRDYKSQHISTFKGEITIYRTSKGSCDLG
ncbi:hypothetical protein I79_000131 [Cricetulus griseus]|uniref:Uncharacterized protein n=1 Tax=Cricetulus griseus TaxID=10029 RepID=G3GRI4_CRIGR|nr:hypothetical protein I79_000131 [Cricetulus griseus]